MFPNEVVLGHSYEYLRQLGNGTQIISKGDEPPKSVTKNEKHDERIQSIKYALFLEKNFNDPAIDSIVKNSYSDISEQICFSKVR